jgi:hypothetical protein
MLQKFRAAQFAIWLNQQLIATLGPTGCPALLPHFLASIFTLVHAVDSYYDSYWSVFGQWRGV